MTLICAPAGYGKTTLLQEWIARSGEPVAWVSLDAGDSDPTRFWSYVIAALQAVQVAENDPAWAPSRGPNAVDVECLLAGLINRFCQSGRELTLVLDDYHVIDSPAIQSAMAFFIEHLPDCVHLVISSRTVPPFPLGRLRARDRLMQIGQADLGFNLDETAAFFGRVGLPALTHADRALVHAKMEGWVAGLQLLAISLQRVGDISGWVARLNGSDRFIAEFLTEEVLRNQPADLQEFLLKTSILERMSAPLCDAVLEQAGPHSQRMFEYLERANLFLVNLDDSGQWYRYHHLFADHLRSRLGQVYPDLVPELYRRASLWYEERALHVEAVQLALAGRDFERGADLIATYSEMMASRGLTRTLFDWITVLPADTIRSRPRLCLSRAWALMPVGLFEQAEACLVDAEMLIEAERGPGADDANTRALLGEAAAVRGRIATIQFDAPRILRYAQLALELLPPERRFLRGIATSSLGIAYALQGDSEAAQQALHSAGALDLGRRERPPRLVRPVFSGADRESRRASPPGRRPVEAFAPGHAHTGGAGICRSVARRMSPWRSSCTNGTTSRRRWITSTPFSSLGGSQGCTNPRSKRNSCAVKFC